VKTEVGETLDIIMNGYSWLLRYHKLINSNTFGKLTPWLHVNICTISCDISYDASCNILGFAYLVFSLNNFGSYVDVTATSHFMEDVRPNVRPEYNYLWFILNGTPGHMLRNSVPHGYMSVFCTLFIALFSIYD
jgi:hypothetical protein